MVEMTWYGASTWSDTKQLHLYTNLGIDKENMVRKLSHLVDNTFCNLHLTSIRGKMVISHSKGKIIILTIRYAITSHKTNFEVLRIETICHGL